MHGIDAMQDIDGNVSINYVGYYYNTQLRNHAHRMDHECRFLV